MSNIDIIDSMRHSSLGNYILPGVTSSLIGGTTQSGCVRLFEMSREQNTLVTPHSHRFAFTCLVLRGQVTNTIWHRSSHVSADLFAVSKLTYQDSPGQYAIEALPQALYAPSDRSYFPGEWYEMTADQIHSIRFSRGAKVLFFEGPNVTRNTVILEPLSSSGAKVNTFKTEDWMFLKEA